MPTHVNSFTNSFLQTANYLFIFIYGTTLQEFTDSDVHDLLLSARNEIARGVNSVITGIKKGDLQLEDVSEELLEETFQVHPPRQLDLLVRTSGEHRLSDFLLWQGSETVLCFTDVLWPDFTYWHLMGAVFQYQTNYMSLSKVINPTLLQSLFSCSRNYFMKFVLL